MPDFEVGEARAATNGISRRRFIGYLIAAPTLVAAADLCAAAPASAAVPTVQPVDFYDLTDLLTDAANLTAGLITVTINPDGMASFALPRAEVGQGITTAVAMVIADELELPLDKVNITLSDARPELADGHLACANHLPGEQRTRFRSAAHERCYGLHPRAGRDPERNPGQPARGRLSRLFPERVHSDRERALQLRTRHTADQRGLSPAGSMFNTSSVRNIYSPEVTVAKEMMVDQVANAMGQDPYQFRRSFARDSRMLAVLDAAARAANWGKRMAPLTAQGIGIHHEYKGYASRPAGATRHSKRIV